MAEVLKNNNKAKKPKIGLDAVLAKMRDFRDFMTLEMKNFLGASFSGRPEVGAHRGFFSFTQLLGSPGVTVDGKLLYRPLGKSRGVRGHVYSTSSRGKHDIFVTEKKP